VCEGGVDKENTPSVSHFERGRGVTCRREGRVMCATKETPSRISSEGGGWRGGVDREPGTPPSRILSEGEVERT
jgi:hypothetical protein